MKTRTLYHATPMENLGSISVTGLKPGCMGLVFGCESPQDSLKFAWAHGVRDVLMVEFSVPEDWVVETFDHSEAFFKCRCFASTKEVPPEKIKNYSRYQL